MTITAGQGGFRAVHQEAVAKLLLVSNRGPIEHHFDAHGRITQRPAGGGVAVALADVARTEPVTWIAAASTAAERELACSDRAAQLAGGGELRFLGIPEEENAPFYGTFCNPILWFVQHSAGNLLSRHDLETTASAAWRTGYVPVNQRFADAVVREIDRAGGNVLVMLHDYHLYLTPRMVRDAHPEAMLQQFVHIPWPGPEQWGALPDEIVRQICRGLLANDSLAFQTAGAVQNFFETCNWYLGREVDVCEHRNEVWLQDRSTHVWSNPISVDTTQLTTLAASKKVNAHRKALAATAVEKTIVRVDRLDPSKNILRGFQAYDMLLRQNPRLRGKVRFLAFLVPSRPGIPEYDTYARQVFRTIESINSRFGTPEWTPITLFYENNREQALGGLIDYDVLLVNPIADGMNLVSKEGVTVNDRDGVLVLSNAAGSFLELQCGALAVDPYDVHGTAKALQQALDMPDEERHWRSGRLKAAVRAHEIGDWLSYLRRDLSTQQYVRTAATPPPSGQLFTLRRQL